MVWVQRYRVVQGNSRKDVVAGRPMRRNVAKRQGIMRTIIGYLLLL